MDQDLKSKIDRIWENFWTGGVTNPLTVIEQITYLLFVKGLDDIQISKERNSVILGTQVKKIFEDDDCRWSNFKDYEAERMYNVMQQ